MRQARDLVTRTETRIRNDFSRRGVHRFASRARPGGGERGVLRLPFDVPHLALANSAAGSSLRRPSKTANRTCSSRPMRAPASADAIFLYGPSPAANARTSPESFATSSPDATQTGAPDSGRIQAPEKLRMPVK